jgi:hypothetical protein
MQYDPINQKEELIKAQLIQNGLNEKEIRFRGESNRRYIRYAYWQKLTESQLQRINLEEDLYEDDDGDDDRGQPIIRTLYSYIIK